MLNVQITPHNQTHSFKLWQFQTNFSKILLDKQSKRPLQKHQTRGQPTFSSKFDQINIFH